MTLQTKRTYSVCLSIALGLAAGCGSTAATVDAGQDTGTLVSGDSGVAPVDAQPDAGPRAPTDERIGDPAIGYFSLEVSPDQKYLVWQEVLGNTAGPLWYCGLDPDTGALIPQDGRGFSLTGIPLAAAPQWGVDQTGVFFVTVDDQGALLVVRPSSPTEAVVERPAVARNTTRRYPYPSRLPNRAQPYVLYLQADASARLQVTLVDLANPSVEQPITMGPIDLNGMMASYVITVFRWFPGLPVFTYGFNDTAGVLQMREVDVSTTPITSRQVTYGPDDHVDDFPFVRDGARQLVGSVDSTAVGAVYRQGADGNYTEVQRIMPPTTLADPQMAVSFEPFEWRGRAYAAFIVLDGGRVPSRFPAEVWVTDLDTPAASSRVSGAGAATRLDPEYFLARDRVFLYYYGKFQMGGVFELHRVDTGL